MIGSIFMLICNYLPISPEYKYTDHLCSFADRDILMRHIGGGVGHCDVRTEEQYEDDSDAEGLEPDDDKQMGAAGESKYLMRMLPQKNRIVKIMRMKRRRQQSGT
jgi:hypothetical protein